MSAIVTIENITLVVNSFEIYQTYKMTIQMNVLRTLKQIFFKGKMHCCHGHHRGLNFFPPKCKHTHGHNISYDMMLSIK